MADNSPKPFVFVLMPFANEFNDIYELGIKAACIEAGAYCERVDEQIFEGSMLERIYNQISKADILISDMTGKNPNVFYETGYAHALGKRVILLTQKAEDIPFDLKQYSHIVYGGAITRLKSDLTNRIKYYFQNPKTPITGEHELAFQVNDIPIQDNPVIECQMILIGGGIRGARLKVAVFNPLNVPYITDSSLALITPLTIKYTEDIMTQAVKTEDGNYLHGIDYIKSIFPKGYLNLEVTIGFDNNKASEVIRKDSNCAIRHFTNLGYKDYPFNLFIKT